MSTGQGGRQRWGLELGEPRAAVKPVLELAVEDADGVRLAAAVGAARVELCAALAGTEGITPSIGVIERACRVGVPVHVLVRPRPGGFSYSAEELEVMERDVVAALGAGAAGVVVGVLAADGGPDIAAMRRLCASARAVLPSAEVTFHRAFDAALAGGTDPAEALSRLAQAGVDRVLTSGGSPDCTAGLAMLGRLVELGREHAPSVQVMAGGGVMLELVPSLLESGVHAVHTSARPRLGHSPTGRADAPDPALAARFAVALGVPGPLVAEVAASGLATPSAAPVLGAPVLAAPDVTASGPVAPDVAASSLATPSTAPGLKTPDVAATGPAAPEVATSNAATGGTR